MMPWWPMPRAGLWPDWTQYESSLRGLLVMARLVQLALAILLAFGFGFLSYACFSEQRWGAIPLALVFLGLCGSCVFSAYKIAFRK